MDIAPSLLTARMALNQQAATLSMIKKASEMDAQIVEMLTASLSGISASGRGQTVNISA
jgi:hypothetical protein